MLQEEFVKVVTKLGFISINYTFIKISKGKASNSVLTIDQVMNDINTWLDDKDCDQDKVEDNLDDLCCELDEENENNRDSIEQFILKAELTKILMTKKNNH